MAKLADPSLTSHPRQIRALFAIILVTFYPSNPKELWDKFKDSLTEDILHRERINTNDETIEFSEAMYNEALVLLENKCLEINNKTLFQVGMVAPIRAENNPLDRDMRREIDYNPRELQTYLAANLPKLQLEQRTAYNTILAAITNECGGLYFIDAPGGTGKTFLLSLILAKVRSENNIALAIASSGIAATLLDGGRAAQLGYRAHFLQHF